MPHYCSALPWSFNVVISFRKPKEEAWLIFELLILRFANRGITKYCLDLLNAYLD